MKRALVNNCGLFFTAYNAGANAALCRRFGSKYYDAHFCSSGSVFGSTFFAANDPDTMERIWRYYVCDAQLVNWGRATHRNGHILDLDYLLGLFQSDVGRLNLDALFASGVKVVYTLTSYRTGEPIYAQVSRENIWNLMRGSCAVPFMYRSIFIPHYGWVIDGGLSVACPVKYALDLGYEEVTVVYNKPKTYVCSRQEQLASALTSRLLPGPLAKLLRTFDERNQQMERELLCDARVKLIRPDSPLPIRSMWDGDRTRLNATIDRGIADAEQFVSLLSPT